MELQPVSYAAGGIEGLPGHCSTHAWAPSLRAMKGRFDQSFSTAGSAPPSSTPNHCSTSGPLYCHQHRHSSARTLSRFSLALPCMVKINNANEWRKCHPCDRRVSLCSRTVAALGRGHKIHT